MLRCATHSLTQRATQTRAAPRFSASECTLASPLRSFATSSRVPIDSSLPSSLKGPSSAASAPAGAGFSSIHASEIEHFSRLSSQWWDEHGEFGLLHAMNPARIQFMREKLDEVWGWEVAQRQVRIDAGEEEDGAAEGLVGRRPGKVRFLEGLDVVDIGCGGGLLSESLARLGARTTGIDASSSNIGIATTHAAKDPLLSREHELGGRCLTYRHSTAEALLADGTQFDIVCAMEVIEHVNGPAEFLRCLDGLVKPGGHLFLSTIARTPLSYFLTIFMAEHVLRLVTPGTHTHAQYINPEEIEEFFRNDLKWFGPDKVDGVPERLVFETRGTAYLPWKGKWELAPQNTNWPGTKECNYFFWARKPVK
ncbi:Hexaprenyldihydroxybenzoate methyltransferase, mitochondrial [Thecaphora frezii]